MAIYQGWKVSHVTNMQEMFDGATAFNQNISEWDVSQVTNMQQMLIGATIFNQDMPDWESLKCDQYDCYVCQSATVVPSAIYQAGMCQMLPVCTLCFMVLPHSISNISEWKVSNVTTMRSYVLQSATAFNQNISKWESLKGYRYGSHVCRVLPRSMAGYIRLGCVTGYQYGSEMFQGAKAFDQDISKVESLKGDHYVRYVSWNAAAFNQQYIRLGCVTGYQDEPVCFEGAKAFDQDICKTGKSQM